MERPSDWTPNLGPQTQFLQSQCYEVLFGGAAGGSKTESLIVCPLRWVREPSFRGLILRRTFPELEKSFIERSRTLYPAAVPGAKYSDQKKAWQFPSGARIYFGHVEHENDVYQYQGAEFSFIAFDELTHFSLKQYTYLLSRARSSKGLPIRIRAATNPGGPGAEWVFKRWGPWLDPESDVKAGPGKTLWYMNESGGERYVPAGTADTLSRTFIPARLSDNPHLFTNDPGYRQRLMGLDPVTRAQLLEGDWLKKAAPKDYWDREKVTHLDTMPSQAIARVRCWDFGATVDGDWTVGGRLSMDRQGIVAIEHILRFRGTPDKVHSEFSRVALQDQAFDPQIMQVIPQDPGQAGVDQIRSFINENPGITIRARRPTGDKLTRFSPASARAAAGMLVVVRGSWNRELHDELEAVPEQDHDDQMDVIADGVAVLTSAHQEPPPPPEPVDDGRWTEYSGRGFGG